MTYNEWRDELKSNLLCVSESERRRVLDYYAEAYADRREAGFSEREIIEDFGAPYDAAQRILADNKNDDLFEDNDIPKEQTRRERRREEREQRRQEEFSQRGQYYAPPPPPPPAAPIAANNAPAAAARKDYTWVFVLLCIIFAFPLFGLVMSMIGITIGFCAAPIAIIAAGAAEIGHAIGTLIHGELANGLYMLGGGIIIMGIGIILCPLFFKLVTLMWKLFKKFFAWLKSLFSGKEAIK